MIRPRHANGQLAPMNADDRFWAKVDRLASSPWWEHNGCWPWIGSIDTTGYGGFWNGSKLARAHRWSYERFVGPIPEGLHIDHLCRNHRCVNPAHLEPVTNRENALRGMSRNAQNARKTHCQKGHPFSGENLQINCNGNRVCRQCQSTYHKERRARLRRRLSSGDSDTGGTE